VLALAGWGIKKAMGGLARTAADKAIEAATGGKVKWGTNSLPDGWPSDVTVYAGSTIQYSGSSNSANGKGGAAVVFQTRDPAQKISDFYKADLAAKGWKIEGTYSSGSTLMVGATKEGRSLSITITSSDSGSTVTMGVETK
jgi:hypothetical protein